MTPLLESRLGIEAISLRLSKATPQVKISPENPSRRDGGTGSLLSSLRDETRGRGCVPVVSLRSTTG